MRTVFVAVLFVVGATAVHSGGTRESQSALEASPKGWVDILPSSDLEGWNRVPLPVGSQLSPRNPWSVKAGTLYCDGVGLHEILLYGKEMRDGIFHVEWRFDKVEAKADGKKIGYNSGVYVRNSPDGKVWHQAQVGNKNVGFLFGDTLIDGAVKRVKVDDKAPQRGNEAGEWNIYEITCKGKEIALWINGAVTTRWTDCQVPAGHLGLEAEGYKIEFKNMKFKELK